MANILQFPPKNTFDAPKTLTGMRAFKGTVQHAGIILALATGPDCRVEMTVEEVGLRTGRKRFATLGAIQTLVADGTLWRDPRVTQRLTWNMARVEEHYQRVTEEERARGYAIGGIIPPTSKTGQVLSLYLTAERELRRSGQLGAPSSALTARPGEDGQRWLEQWTIDFATDHGVEVERVPRGAWLAFRSFRSNDNGSISYSQRAWPFSFLPGEIRWNPPRFETRVRKRLGIEERTIDVPLFSGRDVPQHFAAAGGAS